MDSDSLKCPDKPPDVIVIAHHQERHNILLDRKEQAARQADSRLKHDTQLFAGEELLEAKPFRRTARFAVRYDLLDGLSRPASVVQRDAAQALFIPHRVLKPHYRDFLASCLAYATASFAV